MHHHPALRRALLAATLLTGFATTAAAQSQQGQLPTGQTVTPLAAPNSVLQTLNPNLPDHPDFRAGYALKTLVSPDGSTLLVMTSGYNNLSYSSGAQLGNFEPQASNEYVFVYDITGAHRAQPYLKQVIQIPDTFVGLVYSPDGSKFYVSGGVDDVVYVYSGTAGSYTQTGAIKLNHATGIGAFQPPSVAGLAISADGRTLVADNVYNDSISLIETQTGTVTAEYDLRPYNTDPTTGQGVAGGETPLSVAIKGTAVYVTSVRDRQVVVLDISTGTPTLIMRIPTPGNPNNLALDAAGAKLYVSQDNSDQVAVIDTATNRIVEEIDAIAPPGITSTPERYTGAAPNAVALSPDGRTLFVSQGGANAVAMVPLTGAQPHRVVGLIPTGYYPHSVSLSQDGGQLYVSNGKSITGPNPDNLTGSTYALTSIHYPGGNQAAENAAFGANEYVYQLNQAGLLSMPVPHGAALATLTTQVAANDFYNATESAADQQTMTALHRLIKHVIYIVKENRTFDQVLGDLANGANAEPVLTVFGHRVTPNFHKMASNFVTLDNFYDPADVSGDGWEWSTAAREVDWTEKTIPIDYASSPINPNGRGAPYDSEGQNRGIDVGIKTLVERTEAEPIYPLLGASLPGGAVNLLPGTNNDGAPDGPNGDRQTGYLWDSALRGGLTVRNYGYFIDLGRYGTSVPPQIPLDPTPFADHVQQAFATNPTLIPLTDIYFRGFDNAYPDLYRFNEWNREFGQFVAKGSLPSLSFVRLMHDHMGDFSTAIGGINTPETQQADNDLAVGKLVEAVAHSPYRSNTLIVVVEDDSQDGPDHVDSHRSTAYFVGPYVRHNAVVSTRYSTVNMLRTIEDILGIDHLNLNDAHQAPMADVFDLTQKSWGFDAATSPFLKGTVDAVGNPRYADNLPALASHDAAWWAAHTQGFDWTKPDQVPAARFNQVLSNGLHAGR